MAENAHDIFWSFFSFILVVICGGVFGELHLSWCCVCVSGAAEFVERVVWWWCRMQLFKVVVTPRKNVVYYINYIAYLPVHSRASFVYFSRSVL